jgi:hypothetical protein
MNQYLGKLTIRRQQIQGISAAYILGKPVKVQHSRRPASCGIEVLHRDVHRLGGAIAFH